MDAPSETVFASDDEEDALRVRDRLRDKQIDCSIKMNSGNYMFGPGVLNAGIPGAGSRFEVQVRAAEIDRALGIISGRKARTSPDPKVKSESTAEEFIPQGVPVEILDRRYLARSVLLGLVYLLGLGTIAAVVSATKISHASLARRAIAFTVPIAWYIVFLIVYFSISPALLLGMLGMNIAALGIYLLLNKKRPIFLLIVVVGVLAFIATIAWAPWR